MPVNHKIFRPFRINIPLNPFVLNAPFLYPLKTSENRNVFWYFQGVKKGCIGTNGLIWAFFSKKKLCKQAYWKKRNIGTKWIKFLFIKQLHERKTMVESNHQKHLFTGFLHSGYSEMLLEKFSQWSTFSELTSQQLTTLLKIPQRIFY